MPGIQTPLQIRAAVGWPKVVIWVGSPPFCGTRQRFCPALGIQRVVGAERLDGADERDRGAVRAERGREVGDDVPEDGGSTRGAGRQLGLGMRDLGRLAGGDVWTKIAECLRPS